jgi:hypothetical protein
MLLVVDVQTGLMVVEEVVVEAFQMDLVEEVVALAGLQMDLVAVEELQIYLIEVLVLQMEHQVQLPEERQMFYEV